MHGNTYYKLKLRRDHCVICGEIQYKTNAVGKKITGKRKKLWSTIDHIVPESHGGASHWYNYAPMCSACNSRKGSISLLFFMLEGQKAPLTHQPSMLDDSNENRAFWKLDDRWFDPCGIMANRPRRLYT